MSTVKSKKLQVGTDATATNNFTIYQPSTPDGTLRIGVGNADSPTEVNRFTSNGITDASGQLLSNTPAFSAYMSGNQSVANVTLVKVLFNTEEFDTAGAFDTSTNRFTVPSGQGGKYLVNQCLIGDSGQNNNRYLNILYLYKNNGLYRQSYQWDIAASYGRNTALSMTNIVDLNAADYLETFAYLQGSISGSGLFVQGGQTNASFSAHKLIT